MITTRKKKIQSSLWRVRDQLRPEKKQIQLSVCWVRGSGDYDWKKKQIQSSVWQIVLYVVSVFGSDGKLKVFLLWREIFITTGKKKDTVVCLVGSRSITTGKKKYSRLSVGCAVLVITTRKKKDTVICLTGCAVGLFFVVAGNFDYNRKKKDTVVCLASCAVCCVSFWF